MNVVALVGRLSRHRELVAALAAIEADLWRLDPAWSRDVVAPTSTVAQWRQWEHEQEARPDAR
jgi:hypothetical protein